MEVRTEHKHGSDKRLVTITYSRSEDDPAGTLAVLTASGRLGHLLRQIGRYNEPDAIAADGREFRQILAALRDAFFHLEPRRRNLLLAGRDQFGLSWGDLALEAELPRQTVVRWVKETRAGFATRGLWYSPDGLIEDPGSAQQASAAHDGHDEAEEAGEPTTGHGPQATELGSQR
jgi:hypothetical protein